LWWGSGVQRCALLIHLVAVARNRRSRWRIDNTIVQCPASIDPCWPLRQVGGMSGPARETLDRLRLVSTATLTTQLFKRGMRNVRSEERHVGKEVRAEW